MTSLQGLFSKPFLYRLMALLLAIGVPWWLLQLNERASPQWTFFLGAFVLGALVLHKLSLPQSSGTESPRSKLITCLKLMAIYFVPASVLWLFLCIQFFLEFLPRVGVFLAPGWPTLSAIFGTMALFRGLLHAEFDGLRRRRMS